jgi:hypothetical protein
MPFREINRAETGSEWKCARDWKHSMRFMSGANIMIAWRSLLLAHIIHEQFYCNHPYAAATSRHAAVRHVSRQARRS